MFLGFRFSGPEPRVAEPSAGTPVCFIVETQLYRRNDNLFRIRITPQQFSEINLGSRQPAASATLLLLSSGGPFGAVRAGTHPSPRRQVAPAPAAIVDVHFRRPA